MSANKKLISETVHKHFISKNMQKDVQKDSELCRKMVHTKMILSGTKRWEIILFRK
jgi:hypothetical protein